MYLLNPYVTGKIWHKFNFLVKYSWFEFRVFLILDYLPNQGKNLVCPTIYP